MLLWTAYTFPTPQLVLGGFSMADDGTRYSYKDYTITTGQASNLNGSTDVDLSMGGSGEDPIQFLNEDLLELGSQIAVMHTDAATDTETQLAVTTDWTAAGSTLTLKATGTTISEWGAGDTIRIQRALKKELPYVDWTNNSIIDADQMDYALRHVFFLNQEVLDAALDSLTLGANGAWNGESIRSYNCAPATTNSGWVTLSQVQNLLAGAETASISDVSYWELIGDDATVTLNLTGFTGTVAAEDLFVHIDGVMQVPTDGYTVAGTNPPIVTFTSAPETGTTAHVRLIEGSVAAVVDSDTINGSALVDDSVDETKFGFTAGAADRYMRIDAAGQPTLDTMAWSDINESGAAFADGVALIRLDEMAIPTNNLDANNNQIKNLTAGDDASNDACNVAQMEAAVAAINTTLAVETFTSQDLAGVFGPADTFESPGSVAYSAVMITIYDSWSSDCYATGTVVPGQSLIMHGLGGSGAVEKLTASLDAGGNTLTFSTVDSLYRTSTVNLVWIP